MTVDTPTFLAVNPDMLVTDTERTPLNANRRPNVFAGKEENVHP